MDGNHGRAGNDAALRIAHDAGNGGGSDTLSGGVGNGPHEQAAHQNKCCRKDLHCFLLYR